MWIKICGTTNREDALAAVNAGANAVGFVFAPSPRRITPEQAREIASGLPGSVEKVGVFVNEAAERVCEVAEQVGLTAVQLQGDEQQDVITSIKRFRGDLRVFKGLSIPKLMKESEWMIAFPKELDAYLLDSGSEDQRGGTGRSFDWSVTSQFFARLGMHTRLIVAGGLNAENVAEAIRLFRPYGVDVCSGTEASPGKKDHAKVRAFVNAVRACEKTAVT